MDDDQEQSKRNVKKREENYTVNLSEEIVEEILLKLPSRSLARFRFVCKPWFSLIPSPNFARTHLKQRRESSHKNPAPETGSFFVPLSSSSLYTVTRNSSSSGYEATKIHTVPPIPLGQAFDILGSCDGLICLMNYDDRNLYLLNPCTRECRKLPSLSNLREGLEFGGFGYDSKHDDYKVFVSVLDNGYTRYKVLSLRNNSWKDVKPLGARIPVFTTSGVYLNGAIHWTALDRENGDWICFFNLAEETFYGMPRPPHKGRVKIYALGLTTQGRICMIWEDEYVRRRHHRDDDGAGGHGDNDNNDGIGRGGSDDDDDDNNDHDHDDKDDGGGSYIDDDGGSYDDDDDDVACDDSDSSVASEPEFHCKDYSELWIMREYGLRESWTKLMSISNYVHGEYLFNFSLFYVMEDGEVLLKADQCGLSWYDPRKERFKDFMPGIPGIKGCLEVVAYTESVLSPYTCCENAANVTISGTLERKDPDQQE